MPLPPSSAPHSHGRLPDLRSYKLLVPDDLAPMHKPRHASGSRGKGEWVGASVGGGTWTENKLEMIIGCQDTSQVGNPSG